MAGQKTAPQTLLAQYEATLTAGASGRRRSACKAVLKALQELPIHDLGDPKRRIWLWSDLHLGHDNIIRYCGRPFKQAQEMDRALYGAWARTLGPDDIMLCLGDVAMGPAVAEHTWRRIEALPGHKVLVVGNHDLTTNGRLRVAGFDLVCGLAILGNENPPLIFTHMPLDDPPPGHVNVHGHLHDHKPLAGPYINVAVEQLGYQPLDLADVRQLAAALVRKAALPGNTTLARLQHLRDSGGNASRRSATPTMGLGDKPA